MKRQDYNRKILSKLKEYIEKYPDLRFGQILINSGIIQQEQRADDLLTIDPFYEEPQITWNRMLKYEHNY